MILVKIYQEFLWSCCGQCGVSSVSDSSLFQLVLVLKVYRPLQCLVNVNSRFQPAALVTSRAVPSFLLILTSSVCKSLSVWFLPWHKEVKVVTYLGSLVQLCCGEGGTLQTNIAGVCGKCSQCFRLWDHPGFAPAHSSVCFPGPHCSGCRVLCRTLSKAGPGFCALPRSKLLGFRFSGMPQGHRLGWACVLCPSPVQAAQVTRCLASTVSKGDCTS